MSKYVTKSAMQDDESYTTDGNNIAYDVEQALQPIFDTYTSDGISVRDISHIVIQKVTAIENRVILRQRRYAETQKPVPDFAMIKGFLITWGLGLNDSEQFLSITSPTISYPTVYDKMLEAALDVGGLIMSKFISSITHSSGTKAYLLPSPSWDRIEDEWNIFKEEKSYLAG